MTNLMIRIVTLATFLIALNAPASFTPAFGLEEEVVVVETLLLTRGTSVRLGRNSRRARRPLRSPRPKKPSSPFSTTPLLPRVTAKPMRPSMTAMNMPRP